MKHSTTAEAHCSNLRMGSGLAICGISYSKRGALWLLHSLGFSCTRPTYTLANADPQKQEAFKKTGYPEKVSLGRGV